MKFALLCDIKDPTRLHMPPVMLVWLEKNVRKPIEGSFVDVYFCAPVKNLYMDIVKQN
jgi:hypothetical protein